MAEYQLIAPMLDDEGNEICPESVKRIIQNGIVGFRADDESSEGERYRAWLADGNTPDPADEEE